MPSDLTSAATDQYTQIQGPAPGEKRSASTLRTIALQPLTDAVTWLRGRLEGITGQVCPIGGPLPLPVTSTDTTGNTLTLSGHGLVNSDVVQLLGVAGGTPPAPLVAGDFYYVVGATSTTLQLASTHGGAAIDITGALNGSVYLVRQNPALDGSVSGSGSTATLTPIVDANGNPGNTYLGAPSANCAITLSTANPYPGKRWRLTTATAASTTTCKYTINGVCTFPAAAGMAWCEFEWNTLYGSGWYLSAWGGATTVP